MEVGNDSHGFCGWSSQDFGKFYSIWVVVDILIKSALFILVRIDYNSEQLAKVYVKEIARLHGVPLSIILDRDGRAVGEDYSSVRRHVEGCVIDFGGHCDKFLLLCEFSYNNSYHSSIDMTQFEALYGRGCRSLIGWFEAGDVKPLGVDLVKDIEDKVRSIQAKLLAAQSRHKKYADHKVRDMTFQTSENVLLKLTRERGDEIRQEKVS
ncbi:hypothetical protein MTR67_013282 [Solanum verrucosum]|uniref:Reverse transcriptase domain-containing protein n=1 Tax=Solanum verrucosum TaxID=315347 RepID=A0AAF0TGR5_SOLVR|nr:hypothetical protein MTR67_013282 [Solanum verrucosum]